ncbi:MAG TPA: hypothetical protein VKU02_02780 [Gemmataceae bacterium]|nr:hypothetical protein [Gemmataceae bacterium]
MVRLKPLAARSAAKQRKASQRIDSRPAPISELPAMTPPASDQGPGGDRTVTCEVCYALIPAQASKCPDCGCQLDRTIAASAVDMEPSSLSPASLAPFANPWRIVGLLVGAALLIALLILILSLWH